MKSRNTLVVIGVGVIGMLLLVYFSFRQDIDAARDRVSTGSQVIDTPCGLIEYADTREGPPVLAVHGAGGGFDQMMELGQSLADSGYRTISMSRFGYLRTPLPADASPMTQADAHACLLDVLNLQKVSVIGGSIGAPSTVQLCMRHTERCAAMVLIVPVIYSPRDEAELPPQRAAFVQWLATRTQVGLRIEISPFEFGDSCDISMGGHQHRE